MFIEFERFGYNALTLSFLVTTLTGTFGAYGLIKQIRRIFKTRSGASISIPYFLFSLTLFVSFLAFGLEKNSLSMLIQSTCRVPFMLVILIGLYLFKGYGSLDWFAVICCIALTVAMFLVSTAGNYFLALNFVAGYFVGHQAWEIFRNKSRGEVDLFFLIVFDLSVVFWTIYGSLIDEWKIWVPCLMHTVLYTIVIACWFTYPEKTSETAGSS